jgi:hypothetical protein
MKRRKDILTKAIEALSKSRVSPEPPQELVDATVAKLAEMDKKTADAASKRITFIQRMRSQKGWVRYAAAIILIVSAYFAGRLSSARPPDAEELYAALKPVMEREMLEPMYQQWQLVLTSSNAALKNQLYDEFRSALNEYAVQTLAASGAATNQLLRELIQSINAAQMQDRRWVASALEQVEMNRMRDRARFADGLETLAVLTEDELQRTKQDVAQLLLYSQPIDSNQEMHENAIP